MGVEGNLRGRKKRPGLRPPRLTLSDESDRQKWPLAVSGFNTRYSQGPFRCLGADARAQRRGSGLSRRSLERQRS